MKKNLTNHKLSSLAPLLLFVIFTTCILLVLLRGADIYKKINERNDDYSQKRTIAQYITTRIHQSDASASIYVGDFDAAIGSIQEETYAPSSETISGDTLFLLEELDGRSLCTRIYCHDGYLRELFSETGARLKQTAGQKILELKQICFTQEDNLLNIQIEHSDGTTETLFLSLRSGKEVSDEK